MSVFASVRQDLKLTQAELAKHLDASQSMIAMLEGGTRRPSVDLACYFVSFCKERGIDMSLERIYTTE